MQNRTWKIGEPCFIVDISIGMMHAHMNVMPGVITHVADRLSRGTSYSARMAGKDFIEGTPFASEKEAREWMRDYADRISAAAQNAKLEGMHPGWQIPQAPNVGDVVYGIDSEAKEVFEACVGLVRLECGRLEVGYDNSQDNVRIREWWNTAEEAVAEARERHGETFTFVSAAEVVRRAKAAEQKIWDNAKVYMNSPEFKNEMKDLAHVLQGKT